MKVTMSLLLLFLLHVFVCANAATRKKIFSLPPLASGKILNGVSKCITKLNIDSAVVKQIKEGRYSNDDRVIKALICSNVESGYGSAEGRINADIVIKEMFLSHPGIQIVMDACEKDYGKTPIENLRSFLICFRENVPFKVRI